VGIVTGPGVIERTHLLGQLRDARPWDVLVIGGGATGLGIAVDAAARGYRTALIEARDFSSGTSSRSTKLVHGGVRYLAQGNVKLVREALAERALLLANAPELVRPLEFIVPCYRLFEREFMRIGLGMYDALAGRRGIGATRWLSSAATRSHLPGVRSEGLQGGVAYWDGQFDDARLAIALMRTAVGLGATVLNYVRVEQIALDACGTSSPSTTSPGSTSNCARRQSSMPPASGSTRSGAWRSATRRRSSRSAVARTSCSTAVSCRARRA
jgi:glycerol-3-phosphate dehydrogenase